LEIIHSYNCNIDFSFDLLSFALMQKKVTKKKSRLYKISVFLLRKVFAAPRKPFAMKKFSIKWLWERGSLLHGLVMPYA
jgi:hypothetical protein